MRDGFYYVDKLMPDGNRICAGFVIKNGKIVRCAPILRRKINYWKTIATRIGD